MPRPPHHARRRRMLAWIVGLIVVLVVIDIVLLTAAVGRTAGREHGTIAPVPTFTSTPSSSVQPSASASASASASSTSASASPKRRMLVAVSATEGWRATAGACQGARGTLERSLDGGKTWTRVPLADGDAYIAGIDGSDGSVSVMVGSGARCMLSVRTSSDGGATWSDGDTGDAGAGLAADGSTLQFSDGTVATPCATPLQAYEGMSTSVVVCKDTFEWRSDGATWVGITVSGLRAVADAGNDYLLARVGVSGCDGVEIDSITATNVTPASEPHALGCDATAPTSNRLTVARSGDAVWLWSGRTLDVSSDGGASW